MERNKGVDRFVQRGWVCVDGIDYWAKELEAFDGKLVSVLPLKDKKSARVFLNDDIICDNACIQAS